MYSCEATPVRHARTCWGALGSAWALATMLAVGRQFVANLLRYLKAERSAEVTDHLIARRVKGDVERLQFLDHAAVVVVLSNPLAL